MEINLKAKQEGISLILILLLLLTLPLKNSLNSISIILLFVYSLIVLFKNRSFNWLIFNKLSPLLLFFLFATISIFYSENSKRAIDTVVRFLPLLLFPFIFSILAIKKQSFLKILKFFTLWMVLLCLYSHSLILIKFFQNNDVIGNLFNNHYSYSSLSIDTIGLHSTYYAYYVLVAIVFLIYFILGEKRRKFALLYFVGLGYLSFFILHLSARTPIVVLFLLLSFFLVHSFYKKKQVIKGILYLLLFFILAGVVGYNVKATRYRFQHIFGFTYYNGIRHDDGINKLKQWEAGIRANENLVFGNGIGDANNSIFTSYENLDLFTYAQRRYNAHNQFIQTYVGLGILGLSILFFLFYYYFKFYFAQSFFIGYVIIAISFVLFQTESFLERHNGIVMFAFLIAFFTNHIFFKNATVNRAEN